MTDFVVSNDLVILGGSASPPSATGSVRLSNTGSIVIRNANDNNDIVILVSPQSDEFDLFNSTVPRITLKNAVTTLEQRLTVQQVGTSTASLTVGGAMVVDTTNFVIRAVAAGATIRGDNAAAFAIINQAASSTVPTLIPNRASLTTGIGAAAADRLSFINLGVETVKIIDGGRFAITQPEQVSIGSGSFIDNAQVNITGTFLDDYGGGPTSTHKLLVNGSVEGDATRTVALNVAQFSASVITQTATESIANISQVQIAEPNITDNLTGSITDAQSLLITGAPTEGVSNWAFRIISGDVEIGGDLIEFGAGGGGSRMLYRGCSTFYLGNLDTPDEMFFGQGSTVTVASAVASFEGNQFKFRNSAANEQYMAVQQASTTVATTTGSSVTAAGMIPAGSFPVGITTRVITAITGPTGYDVGDGTDVDRWGNSISGALNTTSDITDFTSGALTTFPTAQDVVITSDGVDFTAGSIRITVHYFRLQAPAS